MEPVDPEIETLCDLILSASDHTLERYQSEQDRFIARSRELANVVKANKKAILALHDLIKSLKNLVSLIDEVGEETKWKDGVETDRVFASYEFDEARAALKKAGVK